MRFERPSNLNAQHEAYAGSNDNANPRDISELTELLRQALKQEGPTANGRKDDEAILALAMSREEHVGTAIVQQPLEEQSNISDRNPSAELEETLLLRECLYALQGLEGEKIRFWEGSVQSNEYMQDPADYKGVRIRPLALQHESFASRLGSGAMDAVRICGEAGWLYRRIQSYVDSIQNSSASAQAIDPAIKPEGVVPRALAGAFDKELRDYHALLANLESRLLDSSTTLRQLMVEMRMPIARLKTLAMLADGLSNLSGGQLLSALHQHSIHGDTRHKTLVQSMVYAASQSWFNILYQWTMTGTLCDPHHEFFIVENPHVHDDHMWQNRYQINRDNIPLGILERDLVKPSFVVGKGINYIRRCLLDTEWTLEMHDDKEATNETVSSEDDIKLRLGYHYTPTYAKNRTGTDGNFVSPLHRTLAHAAHQVHSHILRSLFHQHHLIQHLWALKQFLLLGQGDFITTLMDGLHQDFEQRDGISGLYAGSLMSIVDGALRSTNAVALPPYTLERLNVELLMDVKDYTFGPGLDGSNSADDEGDDARSGWDIFMLTYDIPSSLQAIVHPKALARYKLIFSLLFRLKRVEYMLNATWRQSTSLHHAIALYAQVIHITPEMSEPYRRAKAFLRQVCLARQSMLHFVSNLQSYLMIGVLEQGWKDLLQKIKVAKTLDEVIQAHETYLEHVVRKSFLHDESMLANRNRREATLALQLDHLLYIARTFCTLQDSLFSDALAEIEAAIEKSKEALLLQDREHEWGYKFEPDKSVNQYFYGLADESMVKKMVCVSDEFQKTFIKVQRGLQETVNGNGFDDPSSYPDESTPTSGRVFAENVQQKSILSESKDSLDVDSLWLLMFQLDYSGYYSERTG